MVTKNNTTQPEKRKRKPGAGRKRKIPEHMIPRIQSLLASGMSADRIRKQFGLDCSNQAIYRLRAAKTSSAADTPLAGRGRLLDLIRHVAGDDVFAFELVIVGRQR